MKKRTGFHGSVSGVLNLRWFPDLHKAEPPRLHACSGPGCVDGWSLPGCRSRPVPGVPGCRSRQHPHRVQDSHRISRADGKLPCQWIGIGLEISVFSVARLLLLLFSHCFCRNGTDNQQGYEHRDGADLKNASHAGMHRSAYCAHCTWE